MNLTINSTGPGYYNNSGPWNGVVGENLNIFNNTPAITHAVTSNFTNMTVGDSAFLYAYILFYGGQYFGSDEGLQGQTMHVEQVGYSQGFIANPTIGAATAYAGTAPSGYNYVYVYTDPQVPTATTVYGPISTFQVYFNTTPTPGTYYISVNSGWNGLTASQTLNTTNLIPVTVPAGTSAGWMIWTNGSNMTSPTVPDGDVLGFVVPTGLTGPGGTGMYGLCSPVGGTPTTGSASFTWLNAACNLGAANIYATQPAIVTGAQNIPITGFGCYSHSQGCEGQSRYGWATGGFAIDMQNATPPSATFLSQTSVLGDALTYNVSGGSFAESAAWGSVTSCTPSTSIGPNTTVPVTTTCVVNIATTPASPGNFVAGTNACIGGPYQEEVAVSSATTVSTGVMQLVFPSYHEGWGAGTIVMQGGPCGQYFVAASSLQGSNYWPVAYQALGATSTSQLLLANCQTGNCLTGGNAPVAPLFSETASLTRAGNVVSAAPNPYVLYVTEFSSTVVVSGCTVDTDLNGTFTVASNSMDNINPSLTWDQSGADEGPDTTCTIGLPNPVYYSYPGAVIVNSPNVAAFTTAANQVPWVAGDIIREAPTASYAATDIQIYHGQSTTPINSPADITVEDDGPIPQTYNFKVSNTGGYGSILATPGSSMFYANGNWLTDFSIKYRPANNGSIIDETGAEPMTSSAKPYFLFKDDAAVMNLMIDTVHGQFNFSKPINAANYNEAASAFAAGTTIGGVIPCTYSGGTASNCPPGSVTSAAAGDVAYYSSATNIAPVPNLTVSGSTFYYLGGGFLSGGNGSVAPGGFEALSYLPTQHYISVNAPQNASSEQVNFYGYPLEFIPASAAGPTSMGFTNGAWNFGGTVTVPGSITVSALASPTPVGSPVVVGTPGTTTYSYACTGVDGNGNETSLGTTTTTTTGNATLSGTNYNKVTCGLVGANTLNVYRTVGGSTQGLIGSTTTGVALSDTGLAATRSAPATNNTGGGSFAGAVAIGGVQTTVSCSTSGTAIFTEPRIGASDKTVKVYLNACVGTASYTFPVAFTYGPQVLSESLTSTVTTLSTASVTVTGATSTGFITLDGF